MTPLYQAQDITVDILVFDGIETPLKKQLKKLGVNIIEFSHGGFVYNPKYIFQLIKIFQTKYDWIHTHNTACQLFAAIASLFTTVNLCTTEHNTSNRRRKWKIFKLIDQWMYSRYKFIISISQATTINLTKHVHLTNPIITIPNGINVKAYANAHALEKEILGLHNNEYLITMVGGFRQQKDQDTIIKAMSLLPENVHLCLVGDGIRKNACVALSNNLHLSNRIHFLGIRSDVPNILKTTDIVIMSSHYEGFGLAAVEGMAAGKPVIASNVPGLADVVRNYGFLFPKGDEVTLANTIRTLLDNPSLYHETALKCYNRAQDYDLSLTVQEYIRVYKDYNL